MGGAIYGAFATPAELSMPPALHQGRFSFLLSEETEATQPSQGYPPPFVSGGGARLRTLGRPVSAEQLRRHTRGF